MFRQIIKILEDIFYPSVCEGCGRVGDYICDRCIRKVFKYQVTHSCHVCKKETMKGLIHASCSRNTKLDGVFVVAEYSDFVESYIGDIKYEFYFRMIDDLVRSMCFSLDNNSTFLKIMQESVLTWVPLSRKRRRWRGFNQSERIALELAEYYNIRHRKLLERNRNTRSQVGLSREKRLENMNGAFSSYNHLAIDERSIILVDDVMTSGGTLEECAKVIKNGGGEKVYGLVFARG